MNTEWKFHGKYRGQIIHHREGMQRRGWRVWFKGRYNTAPFPRVADTLDNAKAAIDDKLKHF